MISVVIPTYNEEENIVRCLESLQHQTLSRDEYEIIVVDGNSMDGTREYAAPLADLVMVQNSKKVGGARNDGVQAARGSFIATTDADCICPPNWLATIKHGFDSSDIVQLYGPVYPIENGWNYQISLSIINLLSATGYHTGILYYTLGCNTAFRKDEFIKAGMYRCIDAGDDLEIALRMRQFGRVSWNKEMQMGFSMRRYRQFGTLKSLYEWLYIVAHGGETEKFSYSRREYK
jgi:glycosyltransferase involved in cell wall biosynthesis